MKLLNNSLPQLERVGEAGVAEWQARYKFFSGTL